MSVRVEICVDRLADAVAAAAAGADRIEVCAGLGDGGGVTPSAGSIRAVCASVRPDVVVLVRPRTGDFVYSATERSAIRHDIDAARDGGAAAVAVGACRADGALDLDAIADWVEHARPLDVVVHRVFDFVPDPLGAIDDLVTIGVRRVLTAGQSASAIEGVARLRELVERAAGRLAIVGAGGVRGRDVEALVHRTGLRQVHASARVASARANGTDIDARLAAAGVALPGAAFDPREVRAIVSAASRASGTA